MTATSKKLSPREAFLKSLKLGMQQEEVQRKKEQEAGLYPTKLNMPIGIQFELTARCNLFCKHCYNDSFNTRESTMRTEDWQNLVTDIIEHEGIFQCILSGGEPLMLGNDIYKIADPLHDNGTGFILITNGLLVDEATVNKLKKYNYYWVQVSIDHLIPEKHDEFRGLKGSFEKAKNAALLFSSAGLPLRIAHSITPENLQYLEEFAEFSYLVGASALICGEIMPSGRAYQHQEILMNEAQLNEMYEKIDKLKKEYAGKMNILASASEEIDMKHKQKTLNSSVIVRPNGDVRLDCTMPFTIGNVHTEKFSTIWREKAHTCWQDEKVTAYIENHATLEHINHLTPDIRL